MKTSAMKTSFLISPWLVCLAVLLFVRTAFAAPVSAPCNKLGDKVTITGRAIGGVNGGTYFEPLMPWCVEFPKNIYHGVRFTEGHLTTTAQKLPSGVFVEVVGILRDAHPEYGVALEVLSFRNIDDEVRASFAEANKKCQEWQKENAEAFQQKAHGGNVYPFEAPQQDKFVRCGLTAVDSITHEVLTLLRPEPKNDTKSSK